MYSILASSSIISSYACFAHLSAIAGFRLQQLYRDSCSTCQGTILAKRCMHETTCCTCNQTASGHVLSTSRSSAIVRDHPSKTPNIHPFTLTAIPFWWLYCKYTDHASDEGYFVRLMSIVTAPDMSNSQSDTVLVCIP